MSNTDQIAFLSSIRDDPDNDTIRLAYADWLEENGARVRCPQCLGTSWMESADPASGRTTGEWETTCNRCHGYKVVADTSNADRAELIRVQVELSRMPKEHLEFVKTSPNHKWEDAGYARMAFAVDREGALLAANETQWRTGPRCATCGGKGHVPAGEHERHRQNVCPHCWEGDAGGLLRKFFYPRTGSEAEEATVDLLEPARVTYIRGMKRVEVPHAAGVWEQVLDVDCPTCRAKKDNPHQPYCSAVRKIKYRPTAWVSAVCRYHPDVIEVVTLDCPLERIDLDGKVTWHYHLRQLPEPLQVVEITKLFDTEAAARTTLARVVVQWIHTFIK